MELSYKRQNAWEKLNEAERASVHEFGEDYKKFMDASKTERLSAAEIVRRAKTEGFRDISEMRELNAGDKVFAVNKSKCVVLAVIGKLPVENGMNIVGSHIDSPRLDVKQNPLYEEHGLSLMKTHYYGGVRKYQWVAMPLALYGTMIKADGSKLDIAIGDCDDDPVLYISDLLPHLSKDQIEKKLGEAIDGEMLNVIAGSIPAAADGDSADKKRIKQTVLKILNEKYGMVEEDFQSAELELVPAGKARDVGFDRSMISAYGHDDRICAYTSMRAIFEAGSCEKTAVALFVDKEEVGSNGNTGMHSRFFTNFAGDLIALQSKAAYGEFVLRKALAKSSMLSADVAAGLDPDFMSAFELLNSAVIGCGVTVVKYAGQRGKSGTSDANAEFVGRIRKLFNDNGVVWQSAELGKIDQGGGGTIGYILANMDMEVLDVGTPLLSMHAPFELASKADLYMTYKAYAAFYKEFN